MDDAGALQAEIDRSMSFINGLVSKQLENISQPRTASSSKEKMNWRDVEQLMRLPPRLGVGASIPLQQAANSTTASSLRAKLTKGNKRKNEARDRMSSDEDEDEDEESRTKSISAKKAPNRQINGIKPRVGTQTSFKSPKKTATTIPPVALTVGVRTAEPGPSTSSSSSSTSSSSSESPLTSPKDIVESKTAPSIHPRSRDNSMIHGEPGTRRTSAFSALSSTLENQESKTPIPTVQESSMHPDETDPNKKRRKKKKKKRKLEHSQLTQPGTGSLLRPPEPNEDDTATEPPPSQEPSVSPSIQSSRELPLLNLEGPPSSIPESSPQSSKKKRRRRKKKTAIVNQAT